MVDFIIHGTISIPTKSKDTFLEDFKKFLESKEAILKGQIRINEFDDAEIVDD